MKSEPTIEIQWNSDALDMLYEAFLTQKPLMIADQGPFVIRHFQRSSPDSANITLERRVPTKVPTNENAGGKPA